MYHLKLIMLVIIISASLLPIAKAEDLTAKLAIYDYPPLYHITADDRLTGSIGSTVNEMCAIANIKCEVKLFPLSRAYAEVVQGTSDITFSSIHPRFDSCCQRTQWEYPWSSGFFSRHHNQSIPSSEEEMIGKKFIMVNGWRSPYRFMPNLDQLEKEGKIVVFRANDIQSAIRMLEHGRADILWGSVDFLWHLHNLNLTQDFKYDPRINLPITIWVHKSKPTILEKLNAAYQILKSNEKLDKDNLLPQKNAPL